MESVILSADEVEKIRGLAVGGHAFSQNILGELYSTGTGGVQQNHQEAIRWYQLSAKQNHVPAQSNLAHNYLNGEGVQHNFKEAVRLFKLASVGGDARAHYELAMCYENGIGTLKNLDEAVRYFGLFLSHPGRICGALLAKHGVFPFTHAEKSYGQAYWKPMFSRSAAHFNEMRSMLKSL